RRETPGTEGIDVARQNPGASAPTLFDGTADAQRESPKRKKAAPAAEDGAAQQAPDASSVEPASARGAGANRRATAQEMAQKQREISVSEFFTKNRHLLGFDSPLKALLTTVKEAVDNSLDACEEAGILPEITIEIVKTGEDRFRVCVEDNGPGI